VTDQSAFLIVLAVWLATGLGTAVLMRARGHALFGWTLIGALFGPLVIGMAYQAARLERDAQPRVISPGTAGPGTVDVLVGIDGSPEATAALATVVALLDSRIRRLTIATVIDYDMADSGLPSEELALARRALVDATIQVAPLEAETVVLPGQPAEALNAYALEHSYDLIAVGRRGAGRSTRLLGSVATKMAHEGAVPVFMASGAKTGQVRREPLGQPAHAGG
jgi:nucleotide-binding universal stress UspA family protein